MIKIEYITLTSLSLDCFL